MKVANFTLLLIISFATVLNAQTLNQENASGEKEGRWVKYFSNNKIKYEGQFHLGKPVGKFIYYYKKGGVKAVSEFSDDGIIANNTTYYENGKLMAEGKFVNQKKDGIWKYYVNQDTNALVSMETYVNGIIDGESITYYPNSGKPAEIVMFKDGKKNGKLLKYFPDGILMTESHYKNGMPNGNFIHYHMDGKVQIEGVYLNGLQIGEWKYFDENGKLVDEEEFKKQESVKEIE
ncbi:MAG: toxin-antitoxin system YwqK family antitoxin [Bacteroidota bacterium]